MSARIYANAADLAPVALAPLPADFDEMLAAAPTLTGSADLAWMGFEGSVNDGEDFTPEEDGAL